VTKIKRFLTSTLDSSEKLNKDKTSRPESHSNNKSDRSDDLNRDRAGAGSPDSRPEVKTNTDMSKLYRLMKIFFCKNCDTLTILCYLVC
jgi:hypothetical protein